MATLLETNRHIEKLEYELAKLKFVSSKYPNFKLNFDKNKDEYIFSHKLVNSNFSNFKINSSTSFVELHVFDELIFEYNGKKEKIIVRSIPKISRVASIDYADRSANDYKLWKQNIFIHKLKFKSKNKELQKKIQNLCDLDIIKVIKSNPEIKLDDDVPERIKKLIIFS